MQFNRTLHLSKAPKHDKLAVTEMREKPVDFINVTARASNFADLGSFAKVSVPVQSIIPWSDMLPIWPFFVKLTIIFGKTKLLLNVGNIQHCVFPFR